MANHPTTAGAREHTFDAIVIGSGISGGWAAKELCESGLRTLVLERGHLGQLLLREPRKLGAESCERRQLLAQGCHSSCLHRRVQLRLRGSPPH